MPDNLPGEIVEQVSVFVVGDIGEVDQPANDIVLWTLLDRVSLYESDYVDLIGSQMLSPEFLARSGMAHSRKVERKGVKACSYLSLGHDDNAGNVDGTLHHQLRRCGDHGRHVGRRLTAAFQLQR